MKLFEEVKEEGFFHDEEGEAIGEGAEDDLGEKESGAGEKPFEKKTDDSHDGAGEDVDEAGPKDCGNFEIFADEEKLDGGGGEFGDDGAN